MFGTQFPDFGNLNTDFTQPPTGTPAPSGMFGGGRLQNILTAAAAGFTARRSPQLSQSLMQPMIMRQQMQMQMQHIQAQQEAEYRRQLALAQAQAQLRLQYPDGEFEQELRQSGILPGTPEWTQAIKTKVNNTLDPVVITPQGPMTRSSILNGGAAGQPAPQGVTFTPIGGPTPQASGGFRP